MKIAYFDCPSGAAGDMILGALVDAGCPLELLRAELGKVEVHGYEISASEVRRAGFRGMKMEVAVPPHSQSHRRLPEILSLIEKSGLSSRVKGQGARIFQRLAEAEGRVHGEPPDRVEFHDVGAVDAIVDVLGSVIGLEALGVSAAHVSPIPIGQGMARGPHGPLPVPTPATLELLRGFPVFDNGIQGELVTPTGAAILTTLAEGAGSLPPMRLEAVGLGAGSRELPIPNFVRLLLGEGDAPLSEEAVEPLIMLETTLDDMTPQLFEPLMERLLEGGALDVYLTPVIMKRSRPGVVLTVSCPPDRVPILTDLIFQETTTLGVRWHEHRRVRLARELVRLPTSHGSLTFKVARRGGRVVQVSPEFEEARRLARERGLPLGTLLEELRRDGWAAFRDSP